MDAESETVRLAAVKVALAEHVRFRAAHKTEERLCALEDLTSTIENYPQ